MADDVLIGGKKLSELKVTELKSELDKRGLQKAGVKSVLMDRLRRAVLREGNSDQAALIDETEEINVEELSDGENSAEREDSGEQPSAKKTPRNLRSTPGGDEGGDSERESSEAPMPPLEVTMDSGDLANDSEQVKTRGRPKKQQAPKDSSLVETPRSGSKDESRSPSQQASERSDQDGNSQDASDKEKMKRGPGRPRKNPQKDSPVPAAAPKSATKAVENSKKVVGSARRKSAPPTKMLVKTEPSIDTHAGSEARLSAPKPAAKADEGPAANASVAHPRSRAREAALDFKRDVVTDDFADKTREDEENQEEEEEVVDGDGLLDQHEEAAGREYDLERSAKAILDVPMEIASPIESEDEELLLDTSDEFGGRQGKAEKGEDPTEEDSKRAEKESKGKVGRQQGADDSEQPAHSDDANSSQRRQSSGPYERNESMSSVQIDPSYQPDAEELLYEGDVETEARLAKAESALDEDGDQRDDCFVFDVTGDTMELDPLEKLDKDEGRKSSEVVPASGQGSAPLPVTAPQGSGTDQERSPLCHLWVSGLASTVSALDLQTLFSTVGQVISAKVVARANSKHHRFGYVTLATPEQAALCITKLNDTELKGRRITVEVSKTSQPNSLGHRGDKQQQQQEAVQAQSSSQAGERTVQASTSTAETGSKTPSSSTKRLMVVDKGDGKKILRVNRKEAPEAPSSSSSSRPRGHSRERRKSSPHQRAPIVRRGSPARRPRSPPVGGRVVSRLEPRRGEPARRVGEQPPYRQVENRGGMNVRLEERRLADDRRQEMLVRRQLEIEHSRREQEMVRRMQETHEREVRDRAIRERELAEIERRFQERERELREKEARERQRREVLERELRERDARERDLRDKERRLREMREQHEKELRERELKLQRDMEREKEMRERAQAEKERQLKEQERKIREEKEKLEKEKVERERRERERRAEEERRLREEQRLREERAKEEQRLREEQKEQERRLKEEKERQERERLERERREHAEQEQRKRASGAVGREQKSEREQPVSQPARQQPTPAAQTQRPSSQTTSQTQRPQQQTTPQTQRPQQQTTSQATQRPSQAPPQTQRSSQPPPPQTQRSSQPTPQTQRTQQPTPQATQRPSQPPPQTQRPFQPPAQQQSQRPPPPQQRSSVKRPFSESDGYDSSLKRPALHDVRGDSYSGSSSVFNRLDGANASGDRAAGMMSGSSGYPQQMSGDISFRLGQSASAGGTGYPIPQTHSGMMEASKSAYPSYGGGGAKTHMTQEQLYAVSEAMESLRNSTAAYNQGASRLGQGYIPVPPVGGAQMMGMGYHRAGVPPDMSSHPSLGRQQMMSSGSMSKHKLPPEDERYNKRLSRPPPPPQGRQSTSFNKRLA